MDKKNLLDSLENISDGVDKNKDGFVVLFMKDGKIRPVMLTEDQATLLNISLSVPFQKEQLLIGKGNVNIIDGELKPTSK